jgi:aldehyde:ferredoxin oxidoreductase
MTTGGFAGNLLDVDLSSGNIQKRPLDAAEAERFLGGLGLTIKLAYDIIDPGTDPLSPDNPIVLGAGPLVGTNVPSSSRIYAVTKLPTSQTISWCGAGGFNFGCQLKNAGYDHVVIRGRARRPVYLKILDDQVEICDAQSLWGKGVEDTSESLWKKFGKRAGVMAIGQAGEHRVPFSMAFIDRISTLGRGGFGAVMGARNLKAIVVEGTQGIRVADRKRYRSLIKPFLQKIRDYPYLKEWQELGLIKSFPMVDKETYFRIKKRRASCVSCPIGCKDVVEIPDGSYQGLVKCTSSVINLYTPVLYGFKDPFESIKCMATIDQYGLDMFEFFSLMGFARALVDHGMIPRDRLEPEIDIRSLGSMETWARKISYREGLGDLLAGGFKGLLDKFGDDALSYAPALIKGMHPYAGPGSALEWDFFGTMELGQVLDPRGPHVGSGGSPTYFDRRPLEVFPRHLTRMGVPEDAIVRILPGLNVAGTEADLKVGRLLRHSHRWFTILGSLGICARAAVNRFYNATLCAELYEAVTGIRTDLDDLRMRADRSWTLLRMANVRDGMDPRAETLPDKWFGTPGFKHYVTGEPLPREECEQMIQDYFDEQGWETETGVPTKTRLEQLGLTECM